METVIRTGHLPPIERFAFWVDAVSQLAMPVMVRSDNAADFQATIRSIDVGGAQLCILDYPPMEAHRTPKLIRCSDPELFCFSLTQNVGSGPLEFSQADKSAVVGSGDMALCDSSQPFVSKGGSSERITMLFPRRLLPFPEAKARRLVAVRLSSREGIAALTAGYLRQLARHAGQCRPDDAARLATVGIDLIAATLAHALDDGCDLPPETGQRILLTRIHDFIQRHLGDPDLSPTTVAAAHGISIRTLHRLFQTQQTTVAAWIRARRLDRCRRDLADPLLYDRPIHAIGSRWGFASAAQFTRAFKTAYGTTPMDYRQHHILAS